jgi:hypothetical protein
MVSAILLILAQAPAIDVGWRPLPDGGFQYVIQIEPELVGALREGLDLTSDVPPALRNVRSFQILVGTDDPPREGVPPADPHEPKESPPQSTPFIENALGGVAWQTHPRGGFEYMLYLNDQGIESLTRGEPIVGDLPDFINLIRGFRITARRPPYLDSTQSDPPPSEASASSPGGPVLTAANEDLENGEGAGPAEPASGADSVASGGPSASDDVADQAPTLLKPPTDQSESQPPSDGSIPDLPVENGPQGANTEPGGSSGPFAIEGADPLGAGKPWLPFVLTLVALFVSIGGNAYLIWVTWATRERYRQLAAELRMREITT